MSRVYYISTMKKFTKVHIIYNPKSTGDSKTMAHDLQKQLRRDLRNIQVVCVPTKYAGHAREIAQKIAKNEEYPLIVSSSGDGGYNEVVNGVMDAGINTAVCAVLPAGNANDHSRTMQKHPLAEQIIKGKVKQIDLIKITIINADKEKVVRYAHSYAGLGLTPVIATELNKHSLNAFNEIVLALKTFNKFKPFEITHRNKTLCLDSLLFGNINQMAKVLTLAPENHPDDGKFEVITFLSHNKRTLIKRLVKAAVSNLNTTRKQKKYTCTINKSMPMQMDGEVIKLRAGSKLVVESAHKALNTII